MNNKGPKSSGSIRAPHLAEAGSAFWDTVCSGTSQSGILPYLLSEPPYCFSCPVIGEPLTFEASLPSCVCVCLFQVAELEGQLGHPAATGETGEELSQSVEELKELLRAKDQVRLYMSVFS